MYFLERYLNDSLLHVLLHFQKLLKGKPHVCTFGYMPFCIRVFVNNSNALSMKMRREKNSFQGHVSYDELKKNWMIFTWEFHDDGIPKSIHFVT